MCASCAQRTLIGSIPRANILLYAELRYGKKQEENRKESTRRAARGTGGAAAQRHGAAAAASGVRPPSSWSYGRDEIGDPPAARIPIRRFTALAA